MQFFATQIPKSIVNWLWTHITMHGQISCSSFLQMFGLCLIRRLFWFGNSLIPTIILLLFDRGLDMAIESTVYLPATWYLQFRLWLAWCYYKSGKLWKLKSCSTMLLVFLVKAMHYLFRFIIWNESEQVAMRWWN